MSNVHMSGSLDRPSGFDGWFGSAVAVNNNIHSGVLNLHVMKAASLSADYVFADGEEGMISEATAWWCGKSLLKIPHREAK